MKEDSERYQGEDGTHLLNAQKLGLKSAHTVVVPQPSADLNKYLVDKFHSPTTSAKPALFESIDLSIYQPSAKCAPFWTSESRLLRWIRVFKTRYFEYLNSDATRYKAVWKEQEAYSSPSKCEKNCNSSLWYLQHLRRAVGYVNGLCFHRAYSHSGKEIQRMVYGGISGPIGNCEQSSIGTINLKFFWKNYYFYFWRRDSHLTEH